MDVGFPPPPPLWTSLEIPQKGGAEWRCGGRNAARAAPPRTRGRRPPIGCNLAPIAAEGSSDEKPLALLTAEDRRRLAFGSGDKEEPDAGRPGRRIGKIDQQGQFRTTVARVPRLTKAMTKARRRTLAATAEVTTRLEGLRSMAGVVLRLVDETIAQIEEQRAARRAGRAVPDPTK